MIHPTDLLIGPSTKVRRGHHDRREKMHAEAHKRKQPDEPATDKMCGLCSAMSKKAPTARKPTRQSDGRPPEGLRSRMFVVVHVLQSSLPVKPIRTDTVTFESQYGLAFGHLDLHQRQILLKLLVFGASERKRPLPGAVSRTGTGKQLAHTPNGPMSKPMK